MGFTAVDLSVDTRFPAEFTVSFYSAGITERKGGVMGSGRRLVRDKGRQHNGAQQVLVTLHSQVRLLR